ncbi:MAG: hypothetical protein ACLU96_11455 [Faecalibacterium prausnitzii]
MTSKTNCTSIVFKKCCIATRTKKNQNTFVFWFFFLSARWKGLEQGGGAQRRKQSAQCNNDDRSLRLKQGGVVGAAF